MKQKGREKGGGGEKRGEKVPECGIELQVLILYMLLSSSVVCPVYMFVRQNN